MFKPISALFKKPGPTRPGFRVIANYPLAMILIGAMILAASGCGQKKPDATSSVVSSQTDANPAPTAGQPFTPPSTVAPPVAIAPDGGADLKDLNHVYIRWVAQTHRRAKTFEEFVAASRISVPAAPTGKKYVMDQAGFIALVNQ
jgi:hypothetical protein